MRMVALALEDMSTLPVEDDLGLAVLSIPKGLTLRGLIDFLCVLKDKNNLPRPWNPALSLLRNRNSDSVKEAYQIIITKSSIKDCQTLMQGDQNVLERLGCRESSLLEAMALFLCMSLAKRCPSEDVFSNPLKGFENYAKVMESHRAHLFIQSFIDIDGVRVLPFSQKA